MTDPDVLSLPLKDFQLWPRTKKMRTPLAFDLELTARCNNNCKHCYINLDADDGRAKKRELTFYEIKKIVDEAVSLGALWCLLTGGEPLLRDDFFDIYHYLKQKGLLITIFTNARLVTDSHVKLFKRLSPRHLEVSVYGISRETYERVTRTSGSYVSFRRGLDRLLDGGVRVRLKTMALRSNQHEMPEISLFCRERGADFFRFDPFLHLRLDGNTARNEEIKSERLSPDRIVELERQDPVRFKALKKECAGSEALENPDGKARIFKCGAGNGSFSVSHDGYFRLCSSLCHPECVYDLRNGNISDAVYSFTGNVMNMWSEKQVFIDKCHQCSLINLCMWCPAHAYLETGELDRPVPGYCDAAYARAAAFGKPEKLFHQP